MPVYSTHPEYDKFVKRWELVRKVVKSEVSEFIFDVDPGDAPRNKRYKQGAQFTNFTARTKKGLVGAVFRRKMVITLPPSIAYLEDDATGLNTGLEKLAQKVAGEVLQAGRHGLLVDYPPADDGLTAEEVGALGLRARIYSYAAESIINWKTENLNGAQHITMIVLKEEVSRVGVDGFTWEERIQYRVLKMVDGQYVQFVFTDDPSDEPTAYMPKDSEGNAWSFIPFVFVGSEDNDLSVDSAPLYDIAMINIGHLRNSADYEEAIFVVGQPTLFITTDMSPESFEAANGGQIVLGSRKGYNLGPGGSAQLLQPNSNPLADEAMKRKEEQAQMMGARLIQPSNINETAEAARGRLSGETSILSIIRNNVNEAIYKCCQYALRFMGSMDDVDEISIDINSDFFEKQLDPNKIMAQIQLLNSGIISKSDIRNNLRRFNEIDPSRTDEEIDADVQNDVDSIDPLTGEPQ